MNSRAITILLVDDPTIVRQGLAKLLDGDGDLCVIGQARNGREAVSKVKELKPDVVLMDVSMPILNGIEATRQIKKLNRNTKVIILSMHSNDRFISELFARISPMPVIPVRIMMAKMIKLIRPPM